jgi:hypothetical protein
MIKIGNITLSNSASIKILIFLIVIPIGIYIYRDTSYKFDPEEELSSAQKSMLEIFDDQKKEVLKVTEKRSRHWYSVGTAGYILMYMFLAAWLVALSDKRIQYFFQGLFKYKLNRAATEMRQEDDLKDLAHEDKVFDYEHKKKMKEVEHLKEMAEINVKNAKGSIDEARAYLIRYASMFAAGMTDRWRSYVFASAMGSKGTPEEDKDLEDEVNRVKADLEREKVRKEKIDNDDRQWKADQNKI